MSRPITTPIPTARETEIFCELAAKCWWQETIAARLGWSKARTDATFRYGRAGVPGFKEFYDKFENTKFEAASVYLELIRKKGIHENNLTALMWMWERQFGWYEKARQKVLEKEMLAEHEASAPANTVPSEDEVAAAEARALASLDEAGSVGEKH